MYVILLLFLTFRRLTQSLNASLCIVIPSLDSPLNITVTRDSHASKALWGIVVMSFGNSTTSILLHFANISVPISFTDLGIFIFLSFLQFLKARSPILTIDGTHPLPSSGIAVSSATQLRNAALSMISKLSGKLIL